MLSAVLGSAGCAGLCRAGRLVIDWREVVECGVTTMGIVPPLNEVEDRHAGFAQGFEAGAIEQFTFQSGEKTFAHGVIET